MKKCRFLWSAHRITERQKAGKSRSIKGKQLKNSRSTASKPPVARLSSASADCGFPFQNTVNSRTVCRSGVFFALLSINLTHTPEKIAYPGSQKPFTIHTVHVKSYHKSIAGKRQTAVTLPGLGLACAGISTSPALAAIPVSMAVFRSSSAHRFLTGEASYYEIYQNK